MSLPVLTTVDDIRSIVAYLKTKPTGATVGEAKAVLDKTILDGRKITAYVFWGLVQRDGERLKLSSRGWELARKSKSEQLVFREIFDSVAPYRSALEWAHHHDFEEITNVDVAAQWHDHHSELLGTDNENTIKDQAVCFLRLADAAGLGTFLIGRRGGTTRLTIDRSALKEYVEAGPSAPPWVEPPSDSSAESQPAEQPARPSLVQTEEHAPAGAPKPSPAPPHDQTGELRVFISHGKNMELVEQVETMLGLADIKSEIAVKEEAPAIPVPDKVLTAMKKCHAAIIVVAVEGTKGR